jgi:uncharacterized protein YdhG (YjbR/CyaY superfamily)
MKVTNKSAKSTAAAAKTAKAFSDEELGAIKDRVDEEKAAKSRGAKADGEGDVLAAIAKMKEPDRAMAERIHAVVKAAAPGLSPKTWYGMPAYATKDGKVMCFFQSAAKFKTRYSTFGFSDLAQLDDGNVWPNAYAVNKLTAADEAKIGALVKKAVG